MWKGTKKFNVNRVDVSIWTQYGLEKIDFMWMNFVCALFTPYARANGLYTEIMRKIDGGKEVPKDQKRQHKTQRKPMEIASNQKESFSGPLGLICPSAKMQFYSLKIKCCRHSIQKNFACRPMFSLQLFEVAKIMRNARSSLPRSFAFAIFIHFPKIVVHSNASQSQIACMQMFVVFALDIDIQID